ncbi:3'-5' exonuclease [Vibrio sp. SS-MA-C1-2]|uniref:3'-5' exonuclease n=1 Tax=Vibrio sp. SS-MA-C1-2 TaxID=2908646 RepID=UPI001F3DF03C|nr:exonuclease domain-containing protein [Vibrio sp. SS-MA-C1-2]UJF17717.1 3'-5' exonuclease [Vibrio sp. SS-MA-C1-2]
MMHQQQMLLQQQPEELISNYFIEVLPDLYKKIEEIDFLVFDFETSGLSSNNSEILSIGWCRVINNRVKLDDSGHFYINKTSTINAHSAVVNHITPEVAQVGVNIDQAVSGLMDMLNGRVAIVHGSVIEKQFLESYFKQLGFDSALPIIWVDTLLFEKSFLQLIGSKDPTDLRLSMVRERYDLPSYSNHHALIDAVSTAELFICQVKRAQALRKTETLLDLLTLSMPLD